MKNTTCCFQKHLLPSSKAKRMPSNENPLSSGQKDTGVWLRDGCSVEIHFFGCLLLNLYRRHQLKSISFRSESIKSVDSPGPRLWRPRPPLPARVHARSPGHLEVPPRGRPVSLSPWGGLSYDGLVPGAREYAGSPGKGRRGRRVS